MKFTFINGSRIREAWDDRSEPESLRFLATAFWRALLLIAFLAILFAFWFGSQELGVVSRAESVTTVSPTIKQPLDPAQIQSALNALSARQNDYQSLSQSPLPSVADPSK